MTVAVTVVTTIVMFIAAVVMAAGKSFGEKAGEDVWAAVSATGYTAVARMILRASVRLQVPVMQQADTLEELTAQLADRDAELDTGRIRLVVFAVSLAVGVARWGGRQRLREAIYNTRTKLAISISRAARRVDGVDDARRIQVLDAQIDVLTIRARAGLDERSEAAAVASMLRQDAAARRVSVVDAETWKRVTGKER